MPKSTIDTSWLPWHDAWRQPLLQALLVFTWCAGFIGYRYTAGHLPVFMVTFWRFLCAVLLLLPWAWSGLKTMPAGALRRQAVIGLLSIAGYIVPCAKAIDLGVSPGLTALAADLLPLAIAAGGLLRGVKTGRWQGIGLVAGLAGVLLVSWGAIRVGSAPPWAYLLPLGSMLALALATFYQKQPDCAAPLSLASSMWVQMVACLPVFALLSGWEGSLQPSGGSIFIISIGWLVLLPTLGGYALYWYCLRHYSMQATSGALYLSPAVTLLWAWMMFGDPLSAGMFVGMAISLFGMLCLNYGEAHRQR